MQLLLSVPGPALALALISWLSFLNHEDSYNLTLLRIKSIKL